MKETMNVPVFTGNGTITFQNRPIPLPQKPEDVLVRLNLSGICGTDLNILAIPPLHNATPNIIIGHEGVGVVEMTGTAVTSLKPGDRVVIAPRLTCGKCRFCRRGLDNQCENYTSVGTSRDGTFSPYICVPASALYQISSSVSQEDAVLFEPLSCVVGSLARSPVFPGENVAVIGSGPIGMLFAMLCRLQGAGKVILVGRSPYRLNIAREVGVTTIINPEECDLSAEVHRLTEIGCDMVIDAVGNQLPVATNLTRRGGRIILFGMRKLDNPAVNQYTITRNDLSIFGTFVGLKPFIPTIKLLESNLIHPSAIITHHVPLANLMDGIALMRNRQAMKVIVDCEA
ncbi:MAG TPA: alcohol dehydrogenase catalytic domain-containing protein [Anaerolineaceae bacterium]